MQTIPTTSMSLSGRKARIGSRWSAPILAMCLFAASSAIITAAEANPKAPAESSKGQSADSASNDRTSQTLEVFPQQVDLQFGDDSCRIAVQQFHPDGSTRDVTDEVQWSPNPAIEVDARVLRPRPTADSPLATGTTKKTLTGTLVGEWQGQTVKIPFEIGDHKHSRTLTFRNDILPVLTKTGCNSGKCHGSASGKDGFRLSLYGFDPEGDYFRITREMSGRRVNLAQPESCLLVNKATGEVPHTGGDLMQVGDPNYVKLVSWIAGGALRDPESMPRPVGIEVFPQRAVLPSPGNSQSMVVLARYSDNSVRDVTEQAVYISNNDAAATATADGTIDATGPGNAFVLARFDQFTSGTEIIVRSGENYPELDFAPNNYIDELTAARWRDLHVLPSEVASDEVFLRRVHLDLTGIPPTPDQRLAFLSDQSPDKRDRLVDQLVDTKAFLDLWVMQLAELLQIRRANGLSNKGLSLYDDWLRDQVHNGVPVNELIRQLIPASGSTFENPATSYYQTETTPQLLAENIAQAFLGTRIQCAQCHNHPFDRWTMDDYYGFAAFVSQVGYKQAKDPREITVFNLGEGSLKHPVAGREVRPKFLGGDFATEEQLDGDYRTALADWLTQNNDAFARNIANVLWAHFLGKGIVDPIDDVRVSNPPSNPELLDQLGQQLAEYDFDVRQLAKDICKSKTYQLTTRKTDWNRWDDRNFSHAQIRRLRAEVLLDSINQITDSSDSLSGLPLGGRAIEIPDGRSNNYFLETFGRSDRATPCSCEVSTSPTLSQALHLLNGENTTGKIQSGARVEKLLSSGLAPVEVAKRLYEYCYCRVPTEDETHRIQTRLDVTSDVKAELEDLFWALLNSNEFIFNH